MASAIITISLFVVGQVLVGLTWAIRLEGKVNVQEQRVSDLKELINSRFDGTDARLQRIERTLNGSLHHD